MADVYKRLGQLIRQAREELDWTQEDLARALSRETKEPISATRISYLETGARKLQLDLLPRIAAALGKPIDYFLDVLKEGPAPPRHPLRAVVFKATQALNPVAKSQVHDIVQQIINRPPSQGEHIDIRTVVDPARLLEKSGVGGPPVNIPALVKVAHACGVEVILRELDSCISGFVVNAEGVKAVVINRSKPHEEVRRVIAHELGHLAWDHVDDFSLDVEYPYELMTNDPKEEREAEEWARALLMPEKWIRQDWEKRSPDVEHMAELYQVDLQVMWMRLMDLSLVDKDHYY